MQTSLMHGQWRAPRDGRAISLLCWVAGATLACAGGDSRTAGGAVDTSAASATPAVAPADTAAQQPAASASDTGRAVAPATAAAATASAATAKTPSAPAEQRAAAAPTTARTTAAGTARARADSTPASRPAKATASSGASPSSAAPAASSPSSASASSATSASAPAGGGQGAQQGADNLLASQAEYNGWKTYHVYCYRCHGVEAMGSDIAPNLRESLKASVTHDVFIETVANGRLEKGMPAWKELISRDKMEELYAYLQARSSGRLAPGRPHMAPKS